MGSFYERLRDNTAAPLIARFGQSLTLTRVVENYDVATGANLATVTAQAVKAVVFSYDRGDASESGIQRGDRKVVIAAQGLAFVPETGDRVTLDGEEWTVIRVIPLAPGGIAVTYELQCRR